MYNHDNNIHSDIKTHGKKYKVRAHNNKHVTTTVIKTHDSESRGQEAQIARAHSLHEGSITQSFKIYMAKSQPY